MQDVANSELPALNQIPWNKGKLTGAKPPLRQAFIGKIIDQPIRRSRARTHKSGWPDPAA